MTQVQHPARYLLLLDPAWSGTGAVHFNVVPHLHDPAACNGNKRLFGYWRLILRRKYYLNPSTEETRKLQIKV